MGIVDSTRTRGHKSTVHRDLAVDSLRGIAIILMVTGHVVGGDSSAGMQVSDDSAWRQFYLLLEDLRMPLFTALSGFVYGLRPLNSVSGYPRFLRGKSRRLIVPLATVGTVFVVMQSIVPGTNASMNFGDYWKLYVYGTGHFWFLQAIFIIFVVVGIADAKGWLARPRNLIGAIATSAIVSVFLIVPDPWAIFSVNGALRLLPFFLLGYFVKMYSDSIHVKPWALLLITVVLFTTRAIEVLSPVAYPFFVSRVIGVMLGLAGISFLLSVRSRLGWRPLARLGYFSYAIYLMHVFGTAPTRITLERLGVHSDVAVFMCCLVVGLALPLLFEITFARIGWISWAFLGQKAYTPPHFGPTRAKH